MNVHESEKAAGILRELGFLQAESEKEADILVFNTCTVRNTAERRALGRIHAAKGKRKDGSILAVIGCIPQQNGYAEKFRKEFPHVDIVLGTTDLPKLGEAILTVMKDKKRIISVSDISQNREFVEDVEAYRTSGENAWVNIRRCHQRSS
jgi:tRNA-2-methylthio-N6-dimethylallyladenosine synthase